MSVQNLFRFVERRAYRNGNEVVPSHDLGDGPVHISVKAKITSPPSELTAVRGKISWGLTLPSRPVPLGTSLIELYFVLAAPTASYRRKGVWAEVLRFLFGRVGVSGSDPDVVATRVTKYCHSKHKLTYDTVRGAPKYFSSAESGIDMEGCMLSPPGVPLRRLNIVRPPSASDHARGP